MAHFEDLPHIRGTPHVTDVQLSLRDPRDLQSIEAIAALHRRGVSLPLAKALIEELARAPDHPVDVHVPLVKEEAAFAGEMAASGVHVMMLDARRPVEEEDPDELISLRADVTGVDNVVFVSSHAQLREWRPSIKIAIDPPQSLDPNIVTASMSIPNEYDGEGDYNVRGAYMPPALAEQARQFIDRNRDVLLSYYDCEIDTAQLLDRLRRP